MSDPGAALPLGSHEAIAAIVANLPFVALYQVVRERDGRIHFTYLGDGIEEILGVTPSEVYAQPSLLDDLIIPADIPRFLSAWEVSMREMTPFQVIVRQNHRVFGLRYSILRSRPRRSADGTIAWDGIQVDVTAQFSGLELPPAEGAEHLRVCAWCTRCFGPDNAWHPTKGLLNLFSPNRLTHGICPECQELFFEMDEVDTQNDS
jgi:hypothetical protein